MEFFEAMEESTHELSVPDQRTALRDGTLCFVGREYPLLDGWKRRKISNPSAPPTTAPKTETSF